MSSPLSTSSIPTTPTSNWVTLTSQINAYIEKLNDMNLFGKFNDDLYKDLQEKNKTLTPIQYSKIMLGQMHKKWPNTIQREQIKNQIDQQGGEQTKCDQIKSIISSQNDLENIFNNIQDKFDILNKSNSYTSNNKQNIRNNIMKLNKIPLLDPIESMFGKVEIDENSTLNFKNNENKFYTINRKSPLEMNENYKSYGKYILTDQELTNSNKYKLISIYNNDIRCYERKDKDFKDPMGKFLKENAKNNNSQTTLITTTSCYDFLNSIPEFRGMINNCEGIIELKNEETKKLNAKKQKNKEILNRIKKDNPHLGNSINQVSADLSDRNIIKKATNIRNKELKLLSFNTNSQLSFDKYIKYQGSISEKKKEVFNAIKNKTNFKNIINQIAPFKTISQDIYNDINNLFNKEQKEFLAKQKYNKKYPYFIEFSGRYLFNQILFSKIMNGKLNTPGPSKKYLRQISNQ